MARPSIAARLRINSSAGAGARARQRSSPICWSASPLHPALFEAVLNNVLTREKLTAIRLDSDQFHFCRTAATVCGWPE
jgi:hypothetical protein